MTVADLLEMRGITLRYGPTVALDGVDFVLRAGEVHALLGENGAGKSSLMQVLVGAQPKDAGAMALAGDPYAPSSTQQAQRRGVVMVFQELTVLGHLTVAQNLWLGRETTRRGAIDRARQRREVEQVLARLGRPDLRWDERVGRLGPADRQMVEIARALLGKARVLVLDEPTSSLGAADAERLFAVVAQLRDEGLGIVWISHSLEEVRRICSRCTVLRDGKLVATADLADIDDGTLVRHMAGRAVEQVFPPAARTAREAILAVNGLAGARLPLRASLTLHRGEIAGIGGLCGAGRTELLQAIFGLRARTAGTVLLRGRPLPGDPTRCWRAGVGLLAEDRKHEGLSLPLPVATNIVLPHLAPLRRFGLVHWPAVFETARALGERVALRCRSPRQPARELSGGNQQKVALARLLHAGCEVLLLDEPTRGIDVGSRQEVYQLLDRLARDGAAILVVSSHLPELLGLCDRIAVLRRGELGAFRAASEWTQESLLHEAMAGPAQQATA